MSTFNNCFSHKNVFMRLPCIELRFHMLCWSEEKLNHVLKTDGYKLFKDLLTNKTFSKKILSWKFSWKLIILTAFLCKTTTHWIVLQFLAQKRMHFYRALVWISRLCLLMVSIYVSQFSLNFYMILSSTA